MILYLNVAYTLRLKKEYLEATIINGCYLKAINMSGQLHILKAYWTPATFSFYTQYTYGNYYNFIWNVLLSESDLKIASMNSRK